jgi:hypothetical protein
MNIGEIIAQSKSKKIKYKELLPVKSDLTKLSCRSLIGA